MWEHPVVVQPPQVIKEALFRFSEEEILFSDINILA
jgi:hypothetical protein